jgi:PAS domain S-box-containing protein
MTLGANRRYWLVLTAIVLSFAGVAWSGLRTAKAARNREALEASIHARSAQSHRVLEAMLDLETGVRGYAVTRDPTYLEPYRRASSHVDTDVAKLLAMWQQAEDGSSHHAQRLPELVAAERVHMQRAIQLIGDGDFEGQRRLFQGGEGKALMDDIRALLARLDKADEQASAEAPRTMLSSIDEGRRILLFIGAFLTLLFTMVYVAMQRERQNRQLAEGVEARHLATLEDRVAKRTADLGSALAAVQVGEKRLRAILDSAFDGIVTADETQTIVQVNPAAAAMFGTTERALLGCPIERLTPKRLRESYADQVKVFATDAAQTTGRFQGRGLRADGQEFPLDCAITRVTLEGHRLYIAVLRDVTEALRTQEELQVGKAKLEAALASMGDAVLISDATGATVHFNDACVRFHRFASRDECLRMLPEYRRSILEVRSADGSALPRAQWAVERALRGESETMVEYRQRRRDTGDAWTASFTFGPIRDAEGAIVGAVVVGRDITAAKKMQAELERSHAALRRLFAEQDRVQEHERARIARDLHDDLQQTLSALNFDLVSARGRVMSKGADPLPLIDSASGLTLEAIASTRRIVADLRPLLLDELGLVPALHELVSRAQDHLSIPCTVHYGEGAEGDLACHADVATCVYRVVQEALNNVGKHAGATEVRVEIERVDGDTIRARVVDDGRGIRAEDRGKLRSLGLLGMAERAHAIGGELTVHGEPGHGTQIELRVPAATASPAGDAPESGDMHGPTAVEG